MITKKTSWLEVWQSLDIQAEPDEILTKLKLKEGK